MAEPWPPPMHIVSKRTGRRPLQLVEQRRKIRTPVAAIGWPNEIPSH